MVFISVQRLQSVLGGKMFCDKYVTYLKNEGNKTFSWEEVRDSFEIHIPEQFNFAYDVLDTIAAETPEKEALVWCDENEERIFTFADISRESKRAANFFMHQGIKKRDIVLLFLRRRYEFWFMLMGLHRIGAIAIPATTQLMPHDIEYRITAAKVKMIVAVDEEPLQKNIEVACENTAVSPMLISVNTEKTGWLSYEKEVLKESIDWKIPEGDNYPCNQDNAIIYFTSGTSGNPKMVAHNFYYPLGHIATALFWQGVKENGRHLSIAETGWAKALWGKLYGQWLCGCAVFVYDMESFNPKKVLEKIAAFKITSFCAPPTVYRYLLRENFENYDLSALEQCTTAGEALTPEMYDKFLEKTGLQMREGYGQTELTLTVGTFPGMIVKPGSMGTAAPGYDIDIIDSEGNSCSLGEVGEIILRLDKKRPFGIFSGYYLNPDKTGEAFQGSIYHTGDSASRDAEGYLWFSGRTDDMIKSSGYRISPFEVESVLLCHPAVFECAVTGVADEKRNQIVKASIVVREGFDPSLSLARDIQLFAKKQAAHYKYPRLIEFVAELPKTSSGKIRRYEIRNSNNKENNKAL